MAENIPPTRVAALLRYYGVGPGLRYSGRKAAEMCGVSYETISRLMRPAPARPRKMQRAIMEKIAAGLDIPVDLLDREMMADWGYKQTVTGSDIGDVLSQLVNFTPRELAELQMEIARMQKSLLQETDQGPQTVT